MRRKGRSVFLIGLVGFLVLVGLASSITYFLREPANPGFLDYPTIVAVHAISGAVYLTFASLQFIGRIRSLHLEYHRWAGRGLVLTGVLVGVTALFIGLVIPFSGWSEAVVIVLFGSLFIVCLFQGFRHIRAKRVDLHREWMMRAFTIALAIASQRVIFIPALLIMGDPTYEQVVFLSVSAWALALGLHSVAAEIWIRQTRRSRARSQRGDDQTGRTEGTEHLPASAEAIGLRQAAAAAYSPVPQSKRKP
jgi:hypothetical protein